MTSAPYTPYDPDYTKMATGIAEALKQDDPQARKLAAQNALWIVPGEDHMDDRVDFAVALAEAGVSLSDLERIADN